MTALSLEQKERLRRARSRAGHIRYGMQTIDDTIQHIARARAEGDHLTLGYDTWLDYVNGEFGADRVKLPIEKRNEYIQLLALAGASQRDIAGTVGVSQPTVQRALGRGDSDESPAEDVDAGQDDSPALVAALKASIEDAASRAQGHRAGPPVGTDPAPSLNAGVDSSEGSTPAQERTEQGGASWRTDLDDHRELTPPGEADDVATGGIPSADPEPVPPTGSGSLNGPPCEKCGATIQREHWDLGYMRCEDCDPDGDHLADGYDNPGCRTCIATCPTCGQRLPNQ